jgi:SAM-dependent methyltransferase
VAGPTARYDEIADFYDATAGQAVTDQATATLLELAGDVRGKRLLDVACGQGRVARELARRGAQVTGLDISAAMLDKARASEAREPLGITYAHADATAPLVLDGQAFGGVVCNYGLSDIDDLGGLLANIARLLTAGGWFVFSLLHPCFPGWDRDAPSSWPPDRGYFHEGWWLAGTPGFRGKVGSSHRMLSTYLNSLARHGLVHDEAAEPRPAADWERRLPGAAPVPLYLVARYQRR